MKLGILITGNTTGDIKQKYGSFAQMFIDLFQQSGYEFGYSYYDLREDNFPESIDECEGWLVTGSENGVYENLPWMIKLKRLIQQINAEEIPLVGICFGHQIIASALGGIVVQSDKGWGLGLHSYELLEHPVNGELEQKQLVINAMHQDQVVVKPKGAKVFARSEFCPYAGLTYGDHIITLQAHPEFNDEYTAAQMLELEGKVFPSANVKEALGVAENSGLKLDSPLMATWMAEKLLSRMETSQLT